MKEQHGLAKRHQLQLREELRIQRIREIRGVQRALDALAQLVLRQSGGGRVDGCERFRKRRAGCHDAIARMHHLITEHSGAHLAEEANALAFLELLLLARIEMHEAHPKVALAVGELHHQRAPSAVLDLSTRPLPPRRARARRSAPSRAM
jgi:hypothetical protein